MCVCVCVYKRERERERARERQRECVCVSWMVECMYMNFYVYQLLWNWLYTHRYTYLYIHSTILEWSSTIHDNVCTDMYICECTASSVEVDSRNARRNAQRNPRWSKFVSLFKWAVWKETCDDHSGCRLALRRAFRVSSSTERAVSVSVSSRSEWVCVANKTCVNLCVCMWICGCARVENRMCVNLVFCTCCK